MLTIFSSLAALNVLILTNFGTACDENFMIMTTFSFQGCYKIFAKVVGPIC